MRHLFHWPTFSFYLTGASITEPSRGFIGSTCSHHTAGRRPLQKPHGPDGYHGKSGLCNVSKN